MQFDRGNRGVSVWAYDISTATVSPYIPHCEIVKAVETLFLKPGEHFDSSTRDQIDVDGTMVHDVGDVTPTAEALWNTGDELLFSIDPILDGIVVDDSGAIIGPAPLIDGGEIMHLTNTGWGTFAITFLSHGGHLWNTAFDVSTTFGYYYEDVDALEAVGTLTGDTDVDTPEPATLVLLALASVAGLKRRRHA